MSIAMIVVALGCRTPEKVRYVCLEDAHDYVRVPETDSTNRREMVRELYLRCLDRYGVLDAPPKAGNVKSIGGATSQPAAPIR